MEIIIGRDQQTRQLCVVKEGTSKLYGQPGSVPMDVSRHHISLQPVGTGKWIIKNLNERNVTFVNGIAVESKTISEKDNVELGNSHYLFPWESLQELKAETIDIRPLKQVWDEYDKGNLALDIAERKFNAIRSATGIISMSAIACAFVFGQGSMLQMILYALAIGVSVVFFIIAHNKAGEVPLKRRKIRSHFEDNYICPKCHQFLGYQGYNILSQKDACPNCKTKFKK